VATDPIRAHTSTVATARRISTSITASTLAAAVIAPNRGQIFTIARKTGPETWNVRPYQAIGRRAPWQAQATMCSPIVPATCTNATRTATGTGARTASGRSPRTWIGPDRRRSETGRRSHPSHALRNRPYPGRHQEISVVRERGQPAAIVAAGPDTRPRDRSSSATSAPVSRARGARKITSARVRNARLHNAAISASVMQREGNSDYAGGWNLRRIYLGYNKVNCSRKPQSSGPASGDVGQ
jgi:hypothetical protein